MASAPPARSASASASPPPAPAGPPPPPPPPFSFAHLPPTHILPTRLSDAALHDLEQQLLARSAPLTYSLAEARLFVADINTPRRCELELKGKGVHTRQLPPGKTDDALTVVKLKWLTDCVGQGKALPLDAYTVYTACRVPPPPPPAAPRDAAAASAGQPPAKKQKQKRASPSPVRADPETQRLAVLARAKRDAQELGAHASSAHRYQKYRRYRAPSAGATTTTATRAAAAGPPPLFRKTTSDFEQEQSLSRTRPTPTGLRKAYACERPHPLNPPNLHFISLLQTIKLSRILTEDPIGLRAYSTSIASITAYPYPLISSSEVLSLPGCDGKLAALFHEYIHSTPTPTHLPDENRSLAAVKELEASEEFQVLRLFFGVWGVGATTAREWYFAKGWRSLDDVVEYGWGSLTRVQQIGVKYYDEFNDVKIHRSEVEDIARVITETARKIRPDIETIVVGGYRRGKELSGDVDLIVTYRAEEEEQEEQEEDTDELHPPSPPTTTDPSTPNSKKYPTGLALLSHLVSHLESSHHVTHTLYLGRGGGFGSQRLASGTTIYNPSASKNTWHDADPLSKAMLVWQFPAPNQNPHHRVDIILSPPSTSATAILGWTGATTYERDLRRYVEKYHGWKFDSGGVWDRRTGERVKGLGGWNWRGGETLEDAERRLIEGMGLRWWEPECRNTG
ncbi:hypothetical protein BDZ91DRAFT_777835 [Kalaharituber pfeilii]|nr:hypothetical protein BDZ91DRAFT_777835 [Kalaharituber pfeilii]